MPRKPDAAHDAAILEALRILRAGSSLELLRPKYAAIPIATWYRWMREARNLYQAEGGDADPKRNEQVQVKKRRGRPPNSEKGKPAATAKPVEGDVLRAQPDKPTRKNLLPPPSQGEETPPPDEGEGGQAPGIGKRIGDQFLIVSAFATKESTVTRRWTEPPDLGAPVPALDRFKSIIHTTEAVIFSSIKKVGDAHAILDPVTLLSALETQRKATADLIKAYEKMRNLESIEQFCESVVAIIKRQNPEHARALIAALREAATPYTSAQWRSTPITLPQ